MIAGFRVGLAGLNLDYPENPEIQFLNPENPAKLDSLIFSYVDLSWVSRVMKNYELGLAGLAGF